MVAMMTATIGRPSKGRSTTRSSAKLKPIMIAMVPMMAAITGTPLAVSRAAAM
jgi:hypothetical protein